MPWRATGTDAAKREPKHLSGRMYDIRREELRRVSGSAPQLSERPFVCRRWSSETTDEPKLVGEKCMDDLLSDIFQVYNESN